MWLRPLNSSVKSWTENCTPRFFSPKLLCRALTSRGYGRLFYLTAEPSRHPRNGMINLGVPKAAMNQFARYIALELAPHGITANLVAPATVQGPDDAVREITDQLDTRIRFNSVADGGEPGFAEVPADR